MQLIQDWLNGSQNFIIGRTLYNTLGSDENLKQLFSQGETEYNKKRLVEELELLNKQETIVVVKKEVTQLKSIAIIEKGFDEISESLNEEWLKYYREMKLWQYKLDEYGDDNSQIVRDACFEICKKIKELEKLMMRAVETYDYYKLNGRLPDSKEKPFELPTEPLQLSKFITTCARQIRRYKNAIEPAHVQLLVDYKEKYKLATGKDYVFKN